MNDGKQHWPSLNCDRDCNHSSTATESCWAPDRPVAPDLGLLDKRTVHLTAARQAVQKLKERQAGQLPRGRDAPPLAGTALLVIADLALEP